MTGAAPYSAAVRPLIATALYAGLRKGELFGLAKRDVDLTRRLLTVRRSYDNDTNKSAREEAVPTPPPRCSSLPASTSTRSLASCGTLIRS
jgi:integrase